MVVAVVGVVYGVVDEGKVNEDSGEGDSYEN